MRCLKPGGLLLLMEFDWNLYSEDRVTACAIADGDSSGGSWMQRIFKGLLVTHSLVTGIGF